MTTSIVEYRPTEAVLADLKDRYGTGETWIVDTKDRMTVAKKARAEIREWRICLEAERKRIKAPALERCKDIDTEAKRITAELMKLEEPVDSAIKAEEARQREEKEKVERLEAERIAAGQAYIASIRDIAIGAVGMKSKDIEARIDALDAAPVTRNDEFASVALLAKQETIAKLHELFTAACAQEAEQAKVAAGRAELARLRAAEDARRNEEAAKLEAEQRSARERMAEEERKARIAREAADSEARALRAKADEEARQERLAEQARLDVERQKLAAKREKVEAVERERKRRAAELLDGREMLRTFVGRFGNVPEFIDIAWHIGQFLSDKGEKTKAA